MYRNIVVAVDGSESSARALNEAIHVATLSNAKLEAVYVLDAAASFGYGYYYDRDAMRNAAREDARLVLESVRKSMTERGVTGETSVAETESLDDDVASALQRYVRRHDADLVVMGTSARRGVRGMLHRSVAERFLRGSSCPVLVVRSGRDAR